MHLETCKLLDYLSIILYLTLLSANVAREREGEIDATKTGIRITSKCVLSIKNVVAKKSGVYNSIQWHPEELCKRYSRGIVSSKQASGITEPLFYD